MADDRKMKKDEAVQESSWKQGKYDPQTQKVIVSDKNQPPQYEIDIKEKTFTPVRKSK